MQIASINLLMIVCLALSVAGPLAAVEHDSASMAGCAYNAQAAGVEAVNSLRADSSTFLTQRGNKTPRSRLSEPMQVETGLAKVLLQFRHAKRLR